MPHLIRPLVLLAVIALAACSKTDDTRTGPVVTGVDGSDCRAALVDAADKTATVDNLTISSTGTGPYAGMKSTTIYRAPDRLRVTNDQLATPANGAPGGGKSDMITIGDETWILGVGGAPGAVVNPQLPPADKWTKLKGGQKAEAALQPVRDLKNVKAASWKNGQCHFVGYPNRGGELEGDATIAGNALTKLTLPVVGAPQQGTLSYEYSAFDSAPPIEPPPSGDVVEAPATPKCDTSTTTDSPLAQLCLN
jgi:hypothetical protein